MLTSVFILELRPRSLIWHDLSIMLCHGLRKDAQNTVVVRQPNLKLYSAAHEYTLGMPGDKRQIRSPRSI